MIDIKSIKDMEFFFSNNLTTPLFPILSDLYYKNGDYDRAKKVCKIGLKKNPESSIAYYILAKIELINSNLSKAEFFLEKSINYNNVNMSSMNLLFIVQIELKRNKIIIKKNVENILLLDKNNVECNNWINKNYKKEKPKQKIRNDLNNKIIKNTKKEKVETKLQNKNTKKENVDINKELASMTLFNIYKSQGYYEQALQVLNILIEKEKNNKEIIKEIQILKSLIEESK